MTDESEDRAFDPASGGELAPLDLSVTGGSGGGDVMRRLKGIRRQREESARSERVLELPQAFQDEIIAHARSEARNLCCGIVAGRNGRSAKLYRCTNTEASRHRWLARQDQVEYAHRDSRDCGLEFVAIYCSRTENEAYPSVTDQRLAMTFYPSTPLVICSIADRNVPVIRAFLQREDTIDELTVRARRRDGFTPRTPAPSRFHRGTQGNLPEVAEAYEAHLKAGFGQMLQDIMPVLDTTMIKARDGWTLFSRAVLDADMWPSQSPPERTEDGTLRTELKVRISLMNPGTGHGTAETEVICRVPAPAMDGTFVIHDAAVRPASLEAALDLTLERLRRGLARTTREAARHLADAKDPRALAPTRLIEPFDISLTREDLERPRNDTVDWLDPEAGWASLSPDEPRPPLPPP